VGLTLFGLPYQSAIAALAATLSLSLLVFFQFCRVLHDSPGVIVASSHYAMPRFYPLWERLSSGRLSRWSGWARRLYYGWMALGVGALFWQGAVYVALGLVMLYGLVQLIYRGLIEESEPLPLPRPHRRSGPTC